MHVEELLYRAKGKGIHFFLKDGKLSYRAKKNAVSAEFKALIIAQKSLIEAYLSKQAQAAKGHVTTLEKIEALPRPDIIPLSFEQQRTWFIDKLELNAVQYNLSNQFILPGPFNRRAFEQALASVLERHEVLRSCYGMNEQMPCQKIQTDYQLPWQYYDVSALNEQQKNRQVSALLCEEETRAFDLSRDLMIRIKLFELDQTNALVCCTLHHIAFDGWSDEILKEELKTLYLSYCNNHKNPLPPLKFQYADYALWQQRMFANNGFDQALNYWMEQLQGLDACHDLPLDKPRPAKQSYRGEIIHRRVAPSDQAQVLKLCRENGATLFMFCQTLFVVLLARYSQNQNIALATSVAGRIHADVEGLIGLFANVLVLRSDLSPDLSFVELFRRNKSMILDAFKHQQLPFSLLVEKMQLQRELSYGPLAQLAISLRNQRYQQIEPDADGNSAPFNIKYELELVVYEHNKGFALGLAYNTDLFERATAELMVDNLLALLKAVSQTEGEVSWRNLNVMGQREQHWLAHYNQTQVNYDQHGFIDRLIAQNVAYFADKTAIVAADLSLCYGQLDQAANQLAYALIQRGVEHSEVVGVCIDRSVEMVVAMLAILKAGATYLPLDPNYPSQRLSYMVSDSGARLVIVDSKPKQWLVAVETLELDLTHQLDNDLGHCPEPQVQRRMPQDLAYLIYTSGSTGKPKGVMVGHDNLMNLVAALNQRFSDQPQRVWLALTSICFDISVLELFWNLSCGQTVVVAPTGLNEQGEFAALIERHGVTHLQCTPSYLRQMSGYFNTPQWSSSLTTVFVGGEAFPQDLADQLAALDGLEVYNMYGPTETTVWSTIAKLTTESKDPAEVPREGALVRGSMPIGQPIGNTEIYILDQRQQLSMKGAIGEVCIGGHGVTQGYLGKAAMTAERFIPDPFSAEAGRRLYLTGDLGRIASDDQLQYVGRIDFQVKLRGFRIELGEIEYLMMTHPQVLQGVVMAFDGGGQNFQRLVAFVVLVDVEDVAEVTTQLRSLLASELPEHMIPEAFVRLDQLPMTANGKLDRRALKPPERADLLLDNYVAPQTANEIKMCEIWARMFNLDKVGMNDNFFVLGGHSLMIVKLLAQVQAEFNVELALRVLFETPTVAGLLLQVEQAEEKRLASIVKIPAQQYYQVSYHQQLSWIWNRLSLITGWSGFFLQKMFSVGDLPADVLIEALNRLFDRHDVFKSTLLVIDGQLMQQFNPLPLIDEQHDVIDLRSDTDPQQQIMAIKQQQMDQMVDFSKPPYCFAKVIMTKEQNYVLLTLDHICVDETAFNFLQQEFGGIIEYLLAGNRDVLPPLAVDYRDYCHWESQQINGSQGELHSHYWRQRIGSDLSILNPLRYFCDYPNDDCDSYRRQMTTEFAQIGANVDQDFFALAYGTTSTISLAAKKVARFKFCVDQQTYTRLKAVAAQWGVMLSVLLSTSVAILLSKLSGRQKSAMTLLNDLRTQEETVNMVGCFINATMLVCDISADAELASVCKAFERQQIDAIDHKIYPLSRLMADLDLSLARVQTIQLNLVNNESQTLQHFASHHEDHGLAGMGIHLAIASYQNGLMIDCEYCCQLFTADTIESVMNYFHELLIQMAGDPELTIAQLVSHSCYPK